MTKTTLKVETVKSLSTPVTAGAPKSNWCGSRGCKK